MHVRSDFTLCSEMETGGNLIFFALPFIYFCCLVMKSPLIDKSRKVAWFKPFLYPHGTYYGAHKISCSDSAAMNVIIWLDKASKSI